jgi:hypothetical protein
MAAGQRFACTHAKHRRRAGRVRLDRAQIDEDNVRLARMTVPGRVLALAGAIAAAWATGGMAEIGDYEFRLVADELEQGDGAVVAVRLVHKASGRGIPDAVIYATRLDMSPDGMAAMKAPLEPLPSTEPGVYRFCTDLTMAGSWALSLAAKIQGEFGTLQGRLTIKAVEPQPSAKPSSRRSCKDPLSVRTRPSSSAEAQGEAGAVRHHPARRAAA